MRVRTPTTQPEAKGRTAWHFSSWGLRRRTEHGGETNQKGFPGVVRDSGNNGSLRKDLVSVQRRGETVCVGLKKGVLSQEG